MYIVDDEKLKDLVEQCLARAEELDIKFVAITTSDAPEVDGIPQKHYSSIGNLTLANTPLIPMYVDYTNDLCEIMGEDRAIPILHHNNRALQNYMWAELDKVKESAS